MTENKNPFKDAIQTDALVVKPGVKPITDFNAKQKLIESLEFLTKNDLVEIAEEEHGLMLDRRLTKQKMIDAIMDEIEKE